MRDYVLTAFVFGCIPLMLKRPHYAILMWVWLSVMNPHRLTWSFAYSMPFAMVTALVTLASLLMTKEKKEFPWTPTTVVMVMFALWMVPVQIFALTPDSYEGFIRIIKIQFMTLVSLLILNSRERLKYLVWVLAGSIGYFGVKGGIFTLRGGGTQRVWGPAESYIEGNNELALATLIVIPLIWYIAMQAPKVWIKRALLGAALLCVMSAVGSMSRGALLGLIAMAGFLWLKSRHKGVLTVVMIFAIPFIIMFMPDAWHQRMSSTSNYEQDASAMGRINAWMMAWNLAWDHPLTGGGFSVAQYPMFARYAPDPNDIHAAHSIYFQAMGEMGFVGLALFMLVFFMAWKDAGWVIRRTSRMPELRWAHDLAAMVQVSIVGYAVGGAFLSLTYFDLPYYLVVLMVQLRLIVEKELKAGVGKRVPAGSAGFAPMPRQLPANRRIARNGGP